MIIDERDDFRENIKKTEEFLERVKKGINISTKEIMKIYVENTPQYSIDRIKNVIIEKRISNDRVDDE